MFSYFRAKKMKVQYEALLLKKIYDFTNSIPDIAELAQKLKGLDGTELQKAIAEVLVGFVKNKEE